MCKTKLREIDESELTLPIPVGMVLEPSTKWHGQLGTCKKELKEIDGSGSTLFILVGMVSKSSTKIIGWKVIDESKWENKNLLPK